MGWRFRRTIKVAPGIRLNVSKSGVSTTIGSRGASVNIGKRGVYRNLSIPGTGLYRRDKISGGAPAQRKAKTRQPANSTIAKQEVSVSRQQVRLYGNTQMDVQPSKGERQPFDPSAQMLEIWRSASTPSSSEALEKQLQALKPERYTKAVYHVPAPRLVDLEEELSREADEHIHTLAFWKSYRMKDAYVKEHIVEKYQQKYDEWESQRRAFEEGEAKQERFQNEAYEKVYTEKRDILVARLEGKTELLSGEIERILTESSIPLRKRISCKVRCSTNAVLIDVQLPPTGLFPSEELVSLKSGTTKTKPKTQKRTREEYACYMFSLVAYFAAKVFDVSPAIEQIIISAHAVRENKAGEEADEYIYSGRFLRDSLCSAIVEGTDPEDLCLSVDGQCNMTKTKIFKAIQPIGVF